MDSPQRRKRLAILRAQVHAYRHPIWDADTATCCRDGVDNSAGSVGSRRATHGGTNARRLVRAAHLTRLREQLAGAQARAELPGSPQAEDPGLHPASASELHRGMPSDDALLRQRFNLATDKATLAWTPASTTGTRGASHGYLLRSAGKWEAPDSAAQGAPPNPCSPALPVMSLPVTGSVARGRSLPPHWEPNGPPPTRARRDLNPGREGEMGTVGRNTLPGHAVDHLADGLVEPASHDAEVLQPRPAARKRRGHWRIVGPLKRARQRSTRTRSLALMATAGVQRRKRTAILRAQLQASRHHTWTSEVTPSTNGTRTGATAREASCRMLTAACDRDRQRSTRACALEQAAANGLLGPTFLQVASLRWRLGSAVLAPLLGGGGHTAGPEGAAHTPPGALPPSDGLVSRTQIRRHGRKAHLGRLREQLVAACALTGQPGGSRAEDPTAATATPPAATPSPGETPPIVRLRLVTKSTFATAGPPRAANPTLVSKSGSKARATPSAAIFAPVPLASLSCPASARKACDQGPSGSPGPAVEPASGGLVPLLPEPPRAPTGALVVKSVPCATALPCGVRFAPLPEVPLPCPQPRPKACELRPPPVLRPVAEPAAGGQDCSCSLCWWTRRAVILSAGSPNFPQEGPASLATTGT